MPQTRRSIRRSKPLRKNISVEVVADRAAALSRLKAMIPEGTGVITGGSVTLEEIGFIDLLKSGQSGWNNWKDKIFAEKDSAKQMQLRKESPASDYYLASAHAVSEDGVIAHGSYSGYQITAFAMLSPHAVLVVGCKKIVSNLDAAIKRVREYSLMMENKNQKSMGNPGSDLKKMLITFSDMFDGRITVILVKEKLGF